MTCSAQEGCVSIGKVLAKAAGMALAAVTAMAGTSPSVLDEYEARLATIRAQVPVLAASAEAAAARMLADPRTAIVCQSFPGASEFSNEMLSRAGGIAKISGRVGKADDTAIMLVPARSWEQEGALVLPLLAERRGKAGLVTVIGSRAGMPTNAVGDFWLDNGAPSGEASHGAVNIMANVTLGWMWCCEYAAALSRKGKYPGILRTKVLDDSLAHNQPLRPPGGQEWLGDTDTSVAAGKLSVAYLDRIGQLIRDLRSPALQGAVSNAADIVAARARQGRSIQMSGSGHIVNYELLRSDLKGPYKGLHSSKVGMGLTNGDLLVWFGYMGHVGLMKTGGVDRLTDLGKAGVDVILCEAPAPDARNTAPDILARVAPGILFAAPSPSPIIATIEQAWGMPDADVDIPWPPRRMAPVSGINALLLLRMLDEQVVLRGAVKAP